MVIAVLEILGVVLLVQANALAFLALRHLFTRQDYRFAWLRAANGGVAAPEAEEPVNISDYLAWREAQRQQEEAS